MAVATVEIDKDDANRLAGGFREVIEDAGETPNGVLLAAMATILSDMLGDEIEHLGPALQTIAGLVLQLREQNQERRGKNAN